MSLKRTPPMINRPNLLKTPVTSFGSDPQLNVSSQDPMPVDHTEHNITRRLKRRLLDEHDKPSENISIAEQMKDMFASFETKQTSKLEKLIESILVIQNQNIEIQKSVEFLSARYDDVLEKMAQLELQNKSYEVKIDSLESKIEQLERNSRSSSVEIRNIPKQTSENKTILSSLVKKVGEVIEHPISDIDIQDVYRLKTKNETGNHIVVKFATTISKDGFIKQCRTFNKTAKNNKLNTSHLKLPGSPKPIFIDESLTSLGRRLAYMARQCVKENHYHSTWTSYGKIFIKKSQDSLALRIDCEQDLRNISLK